MTSHHFSKIFIAILLLTSVNNYAQCDLYDGTGTPATTPVWLGCFGTDYNLNIQSPTTYGAWTVDWGDGSPIENGASLVPPAIVPHTYTATVDTFVVTFTETASGCIVQGVVVMEEPTTASIQIPFGGLTQACAPATLEYVNSSTNTSQTTVFTWDFGDGSAPLVLDYTSAGDTVQHTYLQGTVNCETFVTLNAENYCNTSQGGFSQATFNPIRIWDLDDANINASATVLCYPDTIVVFENNTTRNCLAQGNTFQRQEYWNFGDYWGLGYDSIVDWTPWPPTFPYTIGYPGIGTYDVMMIDSNFCGVDTAYTTVTITPPPVASFSLSKDTICVNGLITVTQTATGGANTYTWNFGDGSGWQVTGGGPQSYSYIAPGDYTIGFVAEIGGGSGCSDTAYLPVHVLPIPSANFILNNNNGCDSITVAFTDASVDGITWAWDFGNGNNSILQSPPSQFYPSPGTYPVSLTVQALNGCIDTQINNVNVFQSPIVDFLPLSVCQNTLATFTDLSTSSPTDTIITWDWDFGNGNTSTLQNPTNIYTANGTFNVSLTVSTANCTNTDIIPVTVESVPAASFTQDLNSGCPLLDVSFTNTSTGAALYAWDFGDGNTSILQDATNSFNNLSGIDSNYNVMMIASTAFGCNDTAFSTVTVFYGVTSDFSHDGFPGCAPLDVNFTNTSTIGETYQWDFGDGNSATTYNTTNQYINNTLFIDVYTVELVVVSSNGCTDTSTQNITVYPIPNFGFTAVPDSGCSPLSVSFPSVVGAVAYQWDFGDGNNGTGPTPSHVYSNSTTNDVTYNVELIATSAFGCIDTANGTVKVFPNPTVNFTGDFNTGCHPLDETFTNTSTGCVAYNWDFGDGTNSTSTNASIPNTYYNFGSTPLIYDVSLVGYTDKNCTDTNTFQVTVYPDIIADFTSDTAGCTPVIINFADQSTNAVQWNWDFGDGAIDVVPSPTHVYFNNSQSDTIFNVQLITTSIFGCTDTAYQNILIYPTPNAQFTATPVNQTFPNTTINITNNSGTGGWSYDWDYGDGNTSVSQNPPAYSYSTWGTYDITLVVNSPFCSDTAIQPITIIPPLPQPDFSGSGSGCRPVTLQFTDNSTYVDSYFWEFGDGGTSNQQNPLYSYYVAGIFSVTLTVTGPGGTQSVVHIDSVEVFEKASAFFQYTPTNVYVPNGAVQFFNLSNFADSYYWTFGDGETSTDEFPEHFYENEGTYDVMLIANNANNCPDTMIVVNAILAETGGEVNFPNAFTPNTNGPTDGTYDPNSYSNDIFFPLYEGVVEYKLMVFSRWGELIFETLDPKVGWNGYYRGELVQQDVYVWKAIVKFTNGDELTKVGEVHLIR